MKCCNLCGLIVAVAAFLNATNSNAAAAYSVQDLGAFTDLSSRNDGQPNAISPDGKIAASNVSNGNYHPYVFDGMWNDLGTLGGQEGLCADVNSQGFAVGKATTDGGLTRAFLWTPGGTDGVAGNPQMKDLGTLGGSYSEAYSVNSSGQISGYAQTKLADHAFIISNGTMTDIGSMLGAGLINSYGLSINDSGHVAGIAYNSTFATPHAFYYDGVAAKDIGTLGGVKASALAINNSEHIAGYSATLGGYEHAFRAIDGVMTDLGTLGGGYSYGVGINDSNVVVGGSFVDVGNTIYHAFVCTNTTIVDLNSLLDDSGTGWTLIEARAINDAGKIVGTGQFQGTKHAFLLKPPGAEPNPTITAIEFNANDVLIDFTTIATADYAVEKRDDFETAAWTDAITGLVGTGNVLTATIPGTAGQARRFYRVRLVPR